jgi:hypothetical protein
MKDEKECDEFISFRKFFEKELIKKQIEVGSISDENDKEGFFGSFVRRYSLLLGRNDICGFTVEISCKIVENKRAFFAKVSFNRNDREYPGLVEMLFMTRSPYGTIREFFRWLYKAS